ncbi:MAG: hypothetical protein AAGD14_08860 [Planctomycetota bacterium]
MRYLLVALLSFGLGAGVFYLVQEGDVRRGARTASTERGEVEIRSHLLDNQAMVEQLQARIAELEAQLEGSQAAEENPYPNDSLDKIELLMQDAFAENNVDWLLQVIERLLLMGKEGYPMLRRLIEDIAFRGKFLPGRSDFRVDQMYSAGQIFMKHERQFIGFLNYLLVDNRTVPIMKQFAMVGGAYYVGSDAPGTDELQATLMRKFLEGEGMGDSMIPMMPKQAQERMEVFAMMMSNDKAAIPALKDKLNSAKDERMKSDIIGALAYLGDESMVPEIQTRLKPEGGDFRREIDALARIDSAESHETATNFLRAIPNSKNFYRHASRYVRAGGGDVGIKLIQERIQANPSDPDVSRVIGTLRNYPTQDSLDTLNTIATSSEDDKLKERATNAAADVQKRLNGELPGMPGMPGMPPR